MTWNNDDWRGVKKDVRRIGGLAIGWWILIVILILALGAGIWGLTVATSGIKGQGDAVVIKNSAENWTEAQASFEQNYQDILATDLKIDAAYLALETSPDDKTLQTNYNGLISYCLSVVAKYNADARSYLSEDFRSSDLPPQIDTRNSTTDCKHNQLPTQ